MNENKRKKMRKRLFGTPSFSSRFLKGAISAMIVMLCIFVFTSVYVPSKHLALNLICKRHAIFHGSQQMETSQQSDLPMIYAITPTYARLTQKADLIRLMQTLRLVPRLHWIVVEDSENRTALVTRFLERSRINVTHLNARTPNKDRRPNSPRGVLQRNTALTWLRGQTSAEGVVYFMDDDNAYDVEIFEEMRSTRNVSVWPVGLIKPWFEGPVVKDGKVSGWNSVYHGRKFETDMAGFAVNVRLLLEKPTVVFHKIAGHLEDDLLKQLQLELSDLEPKADNCTKVLVWHTKANSYDVNKTQLAQKFGSSYVETEV